MLNSKFFWFLYAVFAVVIITGFVFMYNTFLFERDISELVDETGDTINKSLLTAIVEDFLPDVSPDKNNVYETFLPETVKFKSYIYSGTEQLQSFTNKNKVNFGVPASYSDIEGITCFRGNNFNNTASYGYVSVIEEKLEKVWWTRTEYIGTWTGVGWNGQPAIVKWSDEARNNMNFLPDKKSKSGLTEVIYGALDGEVYFLDLDDGSKTRSGSINIGAPIKGSVTVDPRGYPLLYVGQGATEGKGGTTVSFGYRIFDLVNFNKLYTINGIDPVAKRNWGAFDSTAKIDKSSDTMMLAGESGVIYNIHLNTQFNKDNYDISINPEIYKYRHEPIREGTVGVECTSAYYKNYMFFGDNNGTLQCIDVNTMTPVWVRDNTDDTDAAIALEVENTETVSLYTSCEVDKQGAGGSSYIRKINALTGEDIWRKSYSCAYDQAVTGGTIASPIVGKCDINDLVIFNIARTNDSYRGKLVAFKKENGEVAWSKDLSYYCWSSPVALYTEKGKSYIIVCDSMGYMYLLDGKTGSTLHTIELESNVEGSPAVFGNMIVVGTRGQKIWGIKIK